eukprot:6397140-Pyramimonas_sp.AAC.1
MGSMGVLNPRASTSIICVAQVGVAEAIGACERTSKFLMRELAIAFVCPRVDNTTEIQSLC